MVSNKKQDVKKIRPIALWLGALIVIALALIIVEGDLLWKVQQFDIFLNSSLFFKQQMVVAGGMLSYLGSFFTQFFYYPWLGVVMLCGWWLLLLWLIKRTFNIPDRWNIIALIPIAVLLTTNMELGYWVYVMKLRGYFFVPTIGTAAGVSLLWGFRKLPEQLWLRIACIVLTVLAGYPLMGVYALATALLMAILSWRLSDKRMQNVIISAVALLAIVAIPLFFYRYVYYQTNIDAIYHTALPCFTISESYPQYMTPYYVLAACFVALVITYRSSWPEPVAKTVKTGKKKNKNGKKEIKEKEPLLRWTLQGALMAALVIGVWHFWYKDDNFHHELRMQRCIEQTDWEGVVKEGTKQKSEPTRSIVMMHNLALSRLGRQCEEMYKFPKGSKRSNTPLPIYMFNTAGRLIFYQYGAMNECHRMCMEEGVEYGWRTEILQYMARTALFNGEQQVARKFLNLLRQTLFYRGWANRMEKLLTDKELLAKDSETGPITHMMHYADICSQSDSYVEKNLMTMLSQLDADDPYFQEQAVLAALWTRNPDDFWPRFEKYLNLCPNNPVPRIFQEAAYLFGNLQQQPFTEELPVTESVKSNFQGFMKLLSQSQGKPTGQQRDYIYQKYGHTYYFEYFFLRDITYY